MVVTTQSPSGAQVARGTSYLFVQGLMENVSGFLFLTVAARILSISEVGAVSALGTIGTLFITIGAFAIPSGVTKYISENLGKNRRNVAKQIYRKALQFGFLTGIVVLLVCLMFSATISQLVVGSFSLQLPIIVLAFDVLVLVLNSFLSGTLFGLQKFRAIALIGITVSGLKLCASLYFVTLGLGLLGVTLGWVAGDLAGSLLSFSFVFSTFGKENNSGEFAFAELFKYSLPLYGAAIVAYLSATVDRLVILSLSNLAVLGVYSVVLAVVNALGIVTSSMSGSLFPQFSQMQGRFGAEALKEASYKASRYVFLIMTPLTIGLAVIAYPTIQSFFGESYTSGWLCLAIVSLTLALTSASTIVSNLLLSLGMTRISLEANVVGVAVAVAVSAILIFPLGSAGAALGRSSLMVASFTYCAYKLKKEFGLHLDINTLKKCFYCSSTMAIVIAFVQFASYSKDMLPFYVVMGCIIYVLMLKLLKVINSQDVLLLEETLPKRFHSVVDVFAKFFS